MPFIFLAELSDWQSVIYLLMTIIDQLYQPNYNEPFPTHYYSL